MKLLIATHNKDKFSEIKAFFNKMSLSSFELVSLSDVEDTDEVVEDGKTYEENAKIKAFYYAKKYNMITLADDSGFEIEFLNHLPGVHSSRFLNTFSYEEKNKLLVRLMEDVPNRDRNVSFFASIIIAWPDETFLSVTHEWKGKMAYTPAGNKGFGYDPIFYLPAYKKTAGELSEDEKNKISHRGLALEKIIRKWNQYLQYK